MFSQLQSIPRSLGAIARGFSSVEPEKRLNQTVNFITKIPDLGFSIIVGSFKGLANTESFVLKRFIPLTAASIGIYSLARPVGYLELAGGVAAASCVIGAVQAAQMKKISLGLEKIDGDLIKIVGAMSLTTLVLARNTGYFRADYATPFLKGSCVLVGGATGIEIASSVLTEIASTHKNLKKKMQVNWLAGGVSEVAGAVFETVGFLALQAVVFGGLCAGAYGAYSMYNRS